MAIPIKGKCDECGNNYLKGEWGETWDGRDVWEIYYDCPSCYYNPKTTEESKEKILKYLNEDFSKDYKPEMENEAKENLLKILQDKHKNRSLETKF